MITINPAGGHRSCNCCGSDDKVVEIMFNNDKTGHGIEVALCAECMDDFAKAASRIARVYTKDELRKCLEDTLYIEERNDGFAYPVLRDCIYGGCLLVMDLDIGNRFPLDTYNQTWRCWNNRPTDKQREEEPWDD